jgi:uncharacterized membrane protein YdjX (TVP38/TMEM64 family)
MTTRDKASSIPEISPRIHWVRLSLTFLGVLALSFGFAFLIQHLLSKASIPIYKFAWLAYLLVFVMSIVANLSVIVPVPFGLSIMIAAATKWNPVLIVLAGSAGGAIGELSGYLAGYLGNKLAIPENTAFYQRIERWVLRYGVWAIFFLALQPVIPFDVGGFIAGTTRMPLRKFLPALWLGKLPKYLVLVYTGIGIINFLPSWLR